MTDTASPRPVSKNRITFRKGKAPKHSNKSENNIYRFMLLDGKRIKKTYIVQVRIERKTKYYARMNGYLIMQFEPEMMVRSWDELIKIKRFMVQEFNEQHHVP